MKCNKINLTIYIRIATISITIWKNNIGLKNYHQLPAKSY